MWTFVNALGGKQPIFYIDVMLVNSDVVLYPVNADLYKWMTQTLRGCVERLVCDAPWGRSRWILLLLNLA